MRSKEGSQVREASKIRSFVLKWCQGKGLDLGCADDKICPGAIGVDNRKWWPGINIYADVKNLTFAKDREYDYVFSSHTLEHLKEDPMEVIEEWLRVIRLGGYLILYLPDMSYYTEPNPEHFQSFHYVEFVKKIREIPEFEYVFSGAQMSGPEDYSFLVVGRRR